MKIKYFLTPVLFFTVTISVTAQQEYTLTTTAANVTASRALIDLPGLTGNPDAIILATPIGTTQSANMNPIGAWYYSGKWNIFNTNHFIMATGLNYKIQYFPNPGPQQFVHLVTQQNLGAEGSYIDNPELNNKPNAQFSIFLNHSPDLRAGSWLNPHLSKSGYSANSGKWYITNVNGQPLQKGAAYNIIVWQGGGTIKIENPGPIKTVPTTSTSCNCPASLPPNGPAGGDLLGNYPSPGVVRLMGRNLAVTAPAIGQVLKWNGSEWSPSNDATYTPAAGSAGNYTAGIGVALNGNELSARNTEALWNASHLKGNVIAQTAPKTGQVLTWGGTSWYPADQQATNVSTGIGLKTENNQISALNSNPIWNAGQLAGRDIMTTAPTVGQVLKWGGGAWLPGNETSTLYNNTVMLKGAGMMTHIPTVTTEKLLPGLFHPFILPAPAKVMVSFNIPVATKLCVGCGITGVYIFVTINDNISQRFYWEVPNNSSLLLSGTHLLELPAGSQIIKLKTTAIGPELTWGYTATQTTMIIQIIPQ